MCTRQCCAHLWLFPFAIFALAVLLIPPGHAEAITFDEWATGRWLDDIAPAEVVSCF